MNRGRRMPRNPRMFWPALRQELGMFMRDRFADREDIVVEKLVNDFAAELKSMVDDYKIKLDSARKRAPIKQSAKAVAAACRRLGMDPPEPGGTVDMKKASKRKKQLVRAYHPDANGGSEATRAEYEAVMEAWTVLEEHQRQQQQQKSSPQPIAQENQGERNEQEQR